ncbi:DNA polymerase III subunit alpha [Paenibacillus alvei TS-15]|jgi:DNA polymerase III subunit epsilon|uniref:DNA polymerase III subunit alpha n=1 Tax=Paenibacillus alvei TS-15 TaxID=1117108 RepID=S9SU26_PAEAL|nr:3'-5' exonuclease [Paenibacillus alvei]EPY09282.1 DNA polymerase III subunit alpha [Paenibacillus alvei TS-15]
MNVSNISNEEYELSGLTIKDLLNQQYCVFDFEGTGIDHHLDHITQIGALKLDASGIQDEDPFVTLVRSPKPIPEHIAELTGITNEAIYEALDFAQVYEAFTEFIGERILVTQAGYEYDIPLLRKECEQARLPMINNLVVDMKAMFTNIHPELADIPSTDFLIQYYQVDGSDLARHDAVGDSILISRLFAKILEEYKERGLDDLIIEDALRVKRFRRPY